MPYIGCVYSGHHRPSKPKYAFVRARTIGSVLLNCWNSVSNASVSPAWTCNNVVVVVVVSRGGGRDQQTQRVAF